ncbi:MAG: DNA-3-methyladenine glycosylase [candidate division NC10 bacterium]
MPLPRRFYLRPARAVARDLLGCVLVSRRRGAITAGRIVETEAYLGPEDKASHAAFRPGSRALFYGEGGFAYVYLNYGLHCCLNATAGRAGRPGCVLIRALEPGTGLAAMVRRRGAPRGSPLSVLSDALRDWHGSCLGDVRRDLVMRMRCHPCVHRRCE